LQPRSGTLSVENREESVFLWDILAEEDSSSTCWRKECVGQLVATIPNFEPPGVYWNWFKMDSWLFGRSLVHCRHPRSPLSEMRLVERAFFGYVTSKERVAKLERWMSEHENLRWPIEMMKKDWINVQSVGEA
jgi:hypothetical protein